MSYLSVIAASRRTGTVTLRPSLKTVTNKEGTEGSGTETINITPTSGNLLLVTMGAYTTSNMAVDNGFTEITQTVSNFGCQAFLWKISNGTETTLTFTRTGTVTPYMCSVYEFENVNNSTPFEDSQFTGRINDFVAVEIPSMTSSNNNSLAISIMQSTAVSPGQDTTTGTAANYTKASEFTSELNNLAWVLLHTLEVESGAVASDIHLDLEDAITRATWSLILIPE